ncbi:MAG: hypothetical protein ACLFWI_25005 [Coleofasciculus sp.]
MARLYIAPPSPPAPIFAKIPHGIEVIVTPEKDAIAARLPL